MFAVIEFPVVARYHHAGQIPEQIRVHAGPLPTSGAGPVKAPIKKL
ncbi:hypothetical protein NA644_05275 [Pseudomonas stutzeri]|jgi:hypothetical protein|nr:hypothetical protein [Stutzerimonas stutzeri]EQM79944.1 hypothetical protein L686_09980 [Stutzerimonas stutzeri MF28]MCI0918091.1 hypothetical protein [Stutzerimonas stutzeri]MCQ4248719.1 hypothetical protein [Stutzerimonas stutzeri]